LCRYSMARINICIRNTDFAGVCIFQVIYVRGVMKWYLGPHIAGRFIQVSIFFRVRINRFHCMFYPGNSFLIPCGMVQDVQSTIWLQIFVVKFSCWHYPLFILLSAKIWPHKMILKHEYVLREVFFTLIDQLELYIQ